MGLGYAEEQEVRRSLYKQKRWHRLEALRVAIEGQMKGDRKIFEETKIMRCWPCMGFMQEELEKIERQQKAIEKKAGLG